MLPPDREREGGGKKKGLDFFRIKKNLTKKTTRKERNERDRYRAKWSKKGDRTKEKAPSGKLYHLGLVSCPRAF